MICDRCGTAMATVEYKIGYYISYCMARDCDYEVILAPEECDDLLQNGGKAPETR